MMDCPLFESFNVEQLNVDGLQLNLVLHFLFWEIREITSNLMTITGLPTSWEEQRDTSPIIPPDPHEIGVDPSNPGGPMDNGGGEVTLLPPVVHHCLQCGRSFADEADLISHQKLLHCPMCKLSFPDKSAMVIHEWTYHIHNPNALQSQDASRSFPCTECGKPFTYKSNMLRHRRVHMGTFTCPECGNHFSCQRYLTSHLKSHQAAKSYVCPDCGRRFSHRLNLNSHRRIHQSKNTYACAYCGHCFSSETFLEAHQAFHRLMDPNTSSTEATEG
ncbi:hypothetical protein GDO81_030085 [Engystomops pustulosus]|uniref:C2H2-type domain-containing protein n=1 Tax=Engystomops pustulosus TaxID=76066 RepID=A0AAV6ZBS4_ENGPU|nr:hypothetical protein GDO81_030085 [Engystomops pustulosus]